MNDEDILREFFESVAWPEGVTTSKQIKGGRAALEALTRLIAAKEQAEKEVVKENELGRLNAIIANERADRVNALTARLRSMCEAMEPFAKAEDGSLVASQCPDHATLAIGPAAERILYRDLRRARAELDAAKKEIGPTSASE